MGRSRVIYGLYSPFAQKGLAEEAKGRQDPLCPCYSERDLRANVLTTWASKTLMHQGYVTEYTWGATNIIVFYFEFC